MHPSLYDITGRRVAVLESGEKAAGRHRVLLDANDVAPGVYFYRLSVGDWSAASRMVVVR